MKNNFLVLVCLLLFFVKGYGQIAEGPARGSVTGGATVSTDSFPDITLNVKWADQPETIARFRKRESESNEQNPFPTNYMSKTKAGSNYIEDRSVKQKRKSSLQNLLVGPDDPISFQGMLDNNKRTPPDPYIAAGPNHVMTVVQSRFRISDKSGKTLTTIDARSWFLSVFPELVFIYDPKVHYDHFANRWIMVWCGDTDFVTKVSFYFVSVSDDDNPLGTWHNWAIPADVNGDQKVSNWVDYPGVGYDDQAFYFVSDQYKFADENYAFAYTKIRILAKEQFYRNDADSVSWTDFWAIKDLNGKLIKQGSRPAINYSISDAYYIAARPNIDPIDFFVMYKITHPLSDPELSAVHVPVTPWQLAPNAQQPGAGLALESDRLLPSEAIYRDSSLWLVHSVASGSDNQFSSIRYLRFDLYSNTAVEDVAFGAENYWYFYPALSVDQNKNIAITFCRSGYTEYAGAYFTWRLNSDPPGLRPSITIKEGQAHYRWLYYGRNRYGDYSGIALDPVDPNLFWMFSEYTESPENNWGIWVYATPLQSLPAIAGTFTSKNTYFRPGLDSVNIQALATNPVDLQVTAVVVPDDSINSIPLKLFDDGIHSDGAANDSLFGNVWPVSNEEQNYSIDLAASQVTSDTIRIKNIARFTTIGPVVLDHYEITSTDTIPNPGNQLKFKFTLRNDGLNATAMNITSRIVPLDTFAIFPYVLTPAYGDIVAGELSTGNRDQYIKFKSDSGDQTARFALEIMSAGYMFWSDTFEVYVDFPSGLENNSNDIPTVYELNQNYPNPFNPTTTIEFSVPETKFVTLKVYNILGEEVTTLVSERLTVGTYKYDWNAGRLASGVYIYKLEAGNFVENRKMILLR